MAGDAWSIEIICVSSVVSFSSVICIVMDSHVFGGFHFHYSLWSHCLCVIPIWILITALRECPFKYHITPKSCYLHHVCHKDINTNSCFLPFDTYLHIERDLFPVFTISETKISLGGKRYIIFSSVNVSSVQWHCGVKSSSSEFSRDWYENK